MDSKRVRKDVGFGFRHLQGRGSILLAFLLCAALGMAQLNTANISGNVTDQSGGAAPGASVVVRNVATGATRTLETNAAGRYEAIGMPVGGYEVEVSLPGFQKVVRSGITLTVGRNAVVDMVLQVGEVTQSITISGEASQVETTTATVTQLVDGDERGGALRCPRSSGRHL